MEQATAPPPADALGQLVVPLTGITGITGRQARGADCVWCGKRLTADDAVDFDERLVDGVRQFPRGCLPCVGHFAFEALPAHVAKCDPCHLAVPDCDQGRTLQRLIKRGRAHLWTEAVS